MGGRMHGINNIPGLQEKFKELLAGSVRVGPIAGDDAKIRIIAAANEFGAEIKPKNGKYLSVPLVIEAKGKSPRDFADLKFIPPKKEGGAPILARVNGESIEPIFVLLKKIVIPERAFLRLTAADDTAQRKATNAAMHGIRRLLYDGGSVRDVLDAIGLSMAASVRSTIVAGVAPANASLTLDLKAGSTPLLDTHQLHKSIAHEVIS